MSSELSTGSSFDLVNRHPDETGVSVYKKRVMLFIDKLPPKAKVTPEDMQSCIVKICRNYRVPHDKDSQEAILHLSRHSYRAGGTAHLVLVDAPLAKVDKLAQNMMEIEEVLRKNAADGEKHDQLFNGIKCFIEAEIPLSREGTGRHCFMVHPTTEKLQRLGFDIELLDSVKPLPRNFTSKTFDVMKPTVVYSYQNFPSIGEAAAKPSAAAETLKAPPKATPTESAAAELRPSSFKTVVSAEAESTPVPQARVEPPAPVPQAAVEPPKPLVEPPKAPVEPPKPPVEPPAPAAQPSEVSTRLVEQKKVPKNAPAAGILEERPLCLKVINGSRVLSDGRITMVKSESFILTEATFVAINGKLELINSPEKFYTVK